MTVRKIILIVVLSFFVIPSGWSKCKLSKLNGSDILCSKLISSSPHVVIFLWSSYCPYCRKELEGFNHYKPESDISFYYINIGSSKEAVGRVLDILKIKESIRKNVLLDRKGNMAESFRIIGVPTFVFLNKGKVIYESHFVDGGLLKRVFSKNGQ